MRTQIYRPLFFSPTNYFDTDGHAFTTDKNAYWCRTEKWYTNHDGARQKLVFSSGTTVNKG